MYKIENNCYVTQCPSMAQSCNPPRSLSRRDTKNLLPFAETIQKICEAHSSSDSHDGSWCGFPCSHSAARSKIWSATQLRMSDGGDKDPLLLRAARGEDVERVPVWMMRQAVAMQVSGFGCEMSWARLDLSSRLCSNPSSSHYAHILPYCTYLVFYVDVFTLPCDADLSRSMQDTQDFSCPQRAG